MSHEVTPGHLDEVKELVTATGFFSSEEIDIAGELIEDCLIKGDGSGYFFLFAYHEGRLAGYTCFGPIPGTAASYDLYWIAVHPDYQKKGIGLKLLSETEVLIKKKGGSRIYVDTSNRLLYSGTRAFYRRSGYRLAAVLDDFYNRGDGKAIYCKEL
ncbi:MAG: GNAT family N-acetyltransferase [Deltaproteobacteria bacterium]|nr:GNAT family N-acetyltransferase [Deltaproteobacteria bacterium]